MPLLQDLAIGSYFADVADPRIERTHDHRANAKSGQSSLIPQPLLPCREKGRVFA